MILFFFLLTLFCYVSAFTLVTYKQKKSLIYAVTFMFLFPQMTCLFAFRNTRILCLLLLPKYTESSVVVASENIQNLQLSLLPKHMKSSVVVDTEVHEIFGSCSFRTIPFKIFLSHLIFIPQHPIAMFLVKKLIHYKDVK
jgi:hypothetical protein